MDFGEIRKNLADVLRGMALAGHRKRLRADAMELEDYFFLLCYMDMLGLPNPALVYLLDIYPYVAEEFHLWHRRMGMDRSPLGTIGCC